MLVIFGILAAALALALFHYATRLLRQLPGSNDAFILDLTDLGGGRADPAVVQLPDQSHQGSTHAISGASAQAA